MVISFASWSVLTVDFLIVLNLALGGVALAALLHLVNAQWRFDIRVISVSFFALYPLAFIMLMILLFGGAITFPWVGSTEPLPHWNNLRFLAAREVLAMIGVGFLYGSFIKLQNRSGDSPEHMYKFKTVAALLPFAHVLYITLVSWDFEMTLLPNWESSMYSINHIVSVSGLFLATLVLVVFFLNKARLFIKPPGNYVFNYLAQMMLGFTILWIYTFFGQYLIIWYGNFASETERIWGMQDGQYSILFWTFIVLKFVIPFSVLAIRYSRHNPRVIVGVAISMVLGSWIERYTWISGTYPSDHMPMTGIFDITVTLAVFGIAAMILRYSLRRNQVIQ